MTKLTNDNVLKKLLKVHGDIVTIDLQTYKNVNTVCRFIDKDYGEFWALAYKVLYRKQGHKNRL